jgi:hypothetical protein
MATMVSCNAEEMQMKDLAVMSTSRLPLDVARMMVQFRTTMPCYGPKWTILPIIVVQFGRYTPPHYGPVRNTMPDYDPVLDDNASLWSKLEHNPPYGPVFR